MTERLPQSEDDRREIMRAQFLAEAALWGIESELTPERIETAVETELSHEVPDPYRDRKFHEQRRYKERKRQEQEGAA